MKILIIQTVRPQIEIMIYDSDSRKVIAEESWVSEKNELEVLVKRIGALVPGISSGSHTSGLDGILVFAGMGKFSSTRIGVTVANMLANFAGLKVFEAVMEEDDNRSLTDVLKIYFDGKPKEVALVTPKYKTEPTITLSKKLH